jgi:hypothetical protein
MVAARAVILAGLAALVTAPRGAAATPVQCPNTLSVAQSVGAAAPPGWTPSLVDRPRSLAGIAFFDGDPANEASLVPSKERKVKGKDEAVWDFVPGKDEIWVGCRYVDTAIVLGQKLPPTTKQCTVIYGPGMVVDSVDCK